MFDPILAPLDGSLIAECVLSHTVAIARAFAARSQPEQASPNVQQA